MTAVIYTDIVAMYYGRNELIEKQEMWLSWVDDEQEEVEQR